MEEESKLSLVKLEQNIKELKEETINRPISYDALRQHIMEHFKINSFDIYYYDLNNEKVNITDDDEFKISSNLIFIDEKRTLESSIYERISKILQDQADEIDEKYSCNICNEKFKENPYYCYQCSKRICKKCLIDLNNRTTPLKCSFCQYELPIEKWLISSNFTGERKEYLELIEEKIKLKDEIQIHIRKEKEFLKEIKKRDELIEKKTEDAMGFKKALQNQIKKNRQLSDKKEEEIDKLKKEKEDLIKKLNKINALTPNTTSSQNNDCLIYTVEEDHIDKDGCITILGENFVKNNRNKGTLIINDNIKIDHLEDKYKLQNDEKKIRVKIDFKNNKINDFSEMFYCCSSLTSIYQLKDLNVSNGNNFNCMFCGCALLNDISPLKNWDVSNGKDFHHMFCECEGLDDISPLKDWDVSNGNDFTYMFCGCTTLSDLSPLKNWNVSNGKEFDHMFGECIFEDKSPINNWNVSDKKVFTEMF